MKDAKLLSVSTAISEHEVLVLGHFALHNFFIFTNFKRN
jgi:hypothetical protein